MNLDLPLVNRPMFTAFPALLQRNINLIVKKLLKINAEYGIVIINLSEVVASCAVLYTSTPCTRRLGISRFIGDLLTFNLSDLQNPVAL